MLEAVVEAVEREQWTEALMRSFLEMMRGAQERWWCMVRGGGRGVGGGGRCGGVGGGGRTS